MKTAGEEPELADADIQVPEKTQPAGMNMVLMLSNFNLNITLLVQADLGKWFKQKSRVL